MILEIHEERTYSTLILRFKGVLDYSTTNGVSPYLKNLENIDRLVLDFQNLEFIDSTGIGSILDAIYLSEEFQFTIELENVHPQTEEIFQMVGLYRILGVVQEGGI